MRNLKVAVVQVDLVWENAQANLDLLSSQLVGIAEADLVLLPEMFASGFSMNPAKVAQSMEGSAVQWLKDQSRRFALCGSLAIAENGTYVNRFFYADQGEIKGYYDKRHLFGYAQEDEHYTAGSSLFRFTHRGWNLAAFVCYDLRFPAWIRQCAGADALLFVANWPERRAEAWNALLRARAIENQAYVLACNRTGIDAHGISYRGDSQVLDMAGDYVLPPQQKEGVYFAELHSEALQAFRRQFPFLNDRDSFEFQ
ncbi:MAG: nitrilase-related carbon-nitrogen hydrolase [Bacteroidia bacterium]